MKGPNSSKTRTVAVEIKHIMCSTCEFGTLENSKVFSVQNFSTLVLALCLLWGIILINPPVLINYYLFDQAHCLLLHYNNPPKLGGGFFLVVKIMEDQIKINK